MTALTPGFHALWPVPLGLHLHPAPLDVNPLLARICQTLRITQSAARNQPADAAFFASDDDLLQRIQLPEWSAFVRFLVDSLRSTVAQSNRAAWGPQPPDLAIHINGLWCQIGNHGAFHDVHTHGNCSWSGVYCVQVDDAAPRCAHPVFGTANGVTRFYGPPFAALGGAHVDLGNAYLQPPQVDVAPLPGQLVVFPAWLAHQALPYAGAADRIILSFNASVHAARGSDQLHAYAAA